MTEETKVCKCCGTEKTLDCFDKRNDRKPINICKVCRRHQQRINNLSKISDPTENQQIQFTESMNYMEQCRAATGFCTGRYSSRIGTQTRTVNAVSGSSNISLKAIAQAAHIRREKLAAMGTEMPPVTLELLVHADVQTIVEAGYTSAECFAVLDANVNKDSDEYFELSDKIFHMPL